MSVLQNHKLPKFVNFGSFLFSTETKQPNLRYNEKATIYGFPFRGNERDMGRLTIYFIFVISLFSFKFSSAQNETTMQDIIEKVSNRTQELEKDGNLEIVNITVDLLVKDSRKSFIRYLDPDFEYTAIAIGDRRIDSLTLSVYRPGISDIEYVSESRGKFPLVHFSIIEPELFEFMVNVNRYSESNITGHFAVIIYHRVSPNLKSE